MADEIETEVSDTLVALIRSSLRYDAVTGKLFWLDREDLRACSRARLSGKEAFTHINHNGYRNGVVGGKHLLAHVVAWVLETGSFPTQDIDHRNGVKTDNSAANLRECSRSQNTMNRPARADNQSGLKGVSFHKGKQRWFSRIAAKGEKTFLGYFATAPEAHQAYCVAAKALHGEFARTTR